MPGTPVIYYGDEIGMGDNIFLGDRDGVRTPMQWSVDRNGGFSRADPAQLVLPPIMDPIYGFASRQRGEPRRATQHSPAQLDAAHARGAQAAPRVRPRHPALPLPRQPQGARLPARAAARRRTAQEASRTRARPSYASSNLSRTAQAVELDLSALRRTGCRWTSSAARCSRRSASSPTCLPCPPTGFYWFHAGRPAPSFRPGTSRHPTAAGLRHAGDALAPWLEDVLIGLEGRAVRSSARHTADLSAEAALVRSKGETLKSVTASPMACRCCRARTATCCSPRSRPRVGDRVRRATCCRFGLGWEEETAARVVQQLALDPGARGTPCRLSHRRLRRRRR